jgi:hypothetical protein
MKARAALALSVAGILLTGSAALAFNTQVLNTTPAVTGNANSVLLPNNAGRTPTPAAVVSTKATPDAASLVLGDTTAPAPAKTAGAPESRDDSGGTAARKSDAGPAGSQPGRTVGSQPNASPPGSQPEGTVGSHTAAGPAVVSVQPGDDKGGLRTRPEPGVDQGGQRKASEPGDDSGGRRSDD